MIKLIDKIVKWYKRDRFKMQNLENMLIEDRQWLIHNTIAKTLTERYRKALSENWHLISFTPISQLRDELNCYPYNKTSKAIDKMKDHNVNLASALYNYLNDNEKREFILNMEEEYVLSGSEIATMLEIDHSEILKLFINNKEK